MAKGMSSGWLLAIVAILAILSESFWPAMAKRDLLQAAGSWTLENDLDSAVTVDCSNQLHDYGSVTLQSSQQWSRQWVISQNFNEVFTCTFQWNAVQANFIVWAQDDPQSYLASCEICEWQIRADGFYFMQPGGSFVREVTWT